jgi:hypothetical protein
MANHTSTLWVLALNYGKRGNSVKQPKDAGSTAAAKHKTIPYLEAM